MATRYCGDVTIRIRYIDADGIYECRLRWPGGSVKIDVGEPKVLKHAVDSPEAYDEVARAAIAFAFDEAETADDGEGLDSSRLAYDEEGEQIARSPSRAVIAPKEAS